MNYIQMCNIIKTFGHVVSCVFQKRHKITDASVIVEGYKLLRAEGVWKEKKGRTFY